MLKHNLGVRICKWPSCNTVPVDFKVAFSFCGEKSRSVHILAGNGVVYSFSLGTDERAEGVEECSMNFAMGVEKLRFCPMRKQWFWWKGVFLPLKRKKFHMRVFQNSTLIFCKAHSEIGKNFEILQAKKENYIFQYTNATKNVVQAKNSIYI